jgi:hypothetical protein
MKAGRIFGRWRLNSSGVGARLARITRAAYVPHGPPPREHRLPQAERAGHIR